MRLVLSVPIRTEASSTTVYARPPPFSEVGGKPILFKRCTDLVRRLAHVQTIYDCATSRYTTVGADAARFHTVGARTSTVLPPYPYRTKTKTRQPCASESGFLPKPWPGTEQGVQQDRKKKIMGRTAPNPTKTRRTLR